MPAIKRILRTNPITGEDGLWVETSHHGVRGVAASAFPTPPAGTAAQRRAWLSQQLTTLANNACQRAIPLASLAPDDPRRTTPEPFCSIVGESYVCQLFQLTVTVLGLAPITVEITAENAAQTVYDVAYGT